jgi:hypothetical protein
MDIGDGHEALRAAEFTELDLVFQRAPRRFAAPAGQDALFL